jgi:predicted acylesterase/phospholipase RssA
MITFNDLRLLHQLEPTKFRELTLTGWDDKNKQSVYFNAKDYPDMPIAVAGRISMAIPPAFASVKYDPGDGKGARHFADGGIGTNMPSEVVTRTNAGDPKTELTGRQRENALVKTGIMTFDEEGAKKSQEISIWERAKATLTGREARPELQGAYRDMHGSDKQNDRTSGIGNKISNSLVGAIAGNPDIGITAQKDQQKIAESGANCFVIAHGDLGTFSLGAGSKRIQAAKEHAREMIREQLKQRENQAYAQEFGSVNEIFKELSAQDKSALLKGPAPNPAQYSQGVNDKNFQADMDLYNLVVKDQRGH